MENGPSPWERKEHWFTDYIIENVASFFYLLKYYVEPLPDIILDNVSYQQWGLDVSEILIMVSTFSAFMIAMLHSYR